MKHFGLIGKTLKHSFSKNYFTEKFSKENIDADYELFELPEICNFENLKFLDNLYGLNVTIPYKEDIIKYLDLLDDEAKEIGAINTIKFIKDKEKITLKGYNTDVIGFRDTLIPLLKNHHKKALILGTGGASKAVVFVLNKLGIEYKFVSRTERYNSFTYNDLNKDIINEYTLIINCSPVGMFPKVDEKPNIPYDFLNSNHLLYDLVYNPIETKFCLEAKNHNATYCNGLAMLYGQAEASWKIWNL